MRKTRKQIIEEKYPDGILYSTCPEAAELGAGKTPECPYCGKPTPFIGFFVGDDFYWLRQRIQPCECPGATIAREAEAKAAQEEAERKKQDDHRATVNELQERSGLAARERGRTFESFIETPENSKALKTAKRYVERIIDGTIKDIDKKSLFLFGSYGTGKTYLATAIANAVIDGEKRTLYTRFGEMCRDVQRAFDKGAKESDGDIMRKYKKCGLLIIDDLGKERFTDWSLALLFEIIDARYRDMRPTVITSNYSVEETVRKMTANGADATTAGAIADRIEEDYFLVQILGQSWRRTARN